MQCKATPTAGSQALPPPQLQPHPGRPCGGPPPPGPPTPVRPSLAAIIVDIPITVVVPYHHQGVPLCVEGPPLNKLLPYEYLRPQSATRGMQ